MPTFILKPVIITLKKDFLNLFREKGIEGEKHGV